MMMASRNLRGERSIQADPVEPTLSKANLTLTPSGGLRGPRHVQRDMTRDCANGGREVVNAVGEGKKAARGIHAFLGQADIPAPRQPSRLGVNGEPCCSGLEAPIRAHELEELYFNEAEQHG